MEMDSLLRGLRELYVLSLESGPVGELMKMEEDLGVQSHWRAKHVWMWDSC